MVGQARAHRVETAPRIFALGHNTLRGLECPFIVVRAEHAMRFERAVDGGAVILSRLVPLPDRLGELLSQARHLRRAPRLGLLETLLEELPRLLVRGALQAVDPKPDSPGQNGAHDSHGVAPW